MALYSLLATPNQPQLRFVVKTAHPSPWTKIGFPTKKSSTTTTTTKQISRSNKKSKKQNVEIKCFFHPTNSTYLPSLVLNPYLVATLCSSFSREIGHLGCSWMLITISTAQYQKNGAPPAFEHVAGTTSIWKKWHLPPAPPAFENVARSQFQLQIHQVVACRTGGPFSLGRWVFGSRPSR